MKYLMKLESFTDENPKESPKINDYVITEWNFPDEPSWSKYINDRIGQIIDIDNRNILQCKYEIDDDVLNKFFRKKKEKNMIYDENGKHYINMKMREKSIKVFSPDKKELELKISANKYNL